VPGLPSSALFPNAKGVKASNRLTCESRGTWRCGCGESRGRGPEQREARYPINYVFKNSVSACDAINILDLMYTEVALLRIIIEGLGSVT